jgi:hypothetical protein
MTTTGEKLNTAKAALKKIQADAAVKSKPIYKEIVKLSKQILEEACKTTEEKTK